MGKIPSYVILIVGVVLLLGAAGAGFHFLITPRKTALAAAEKTYSETKAKADTLPQVKAQYEAAYAKFVAGTLEWQQVQKQIEQIKRARSIPLSFYAPIPAMIRLWIYYREELPNVIKSFIESTGVKLTSPISVPAPPGTPPSPPGGGFMKIPEATTTLTVVGTLQAIERLYNSLPKFNRIGVIGGLSLAAAGGDQLVAQVPLDVFLLVEVPAGGGAAAAGAGAAAPGGAPGAPPGMPGAEGGAPPGAPPGGAGPDPGAGIPAGPPGGGGGGGEE